MYRNREGFVIFNPENAIAFSGKCNLWPNTASKLAVQILTYIKEYAPFCPTSFSLSLAQILRLPRKIKTKCIFRVDHDMIIIFYSVKNPLILFKKLYKLPSCHVLLIQYICCIVKIFLKGYQRQESGLFFILFFIQSIYNLTPHAPFRHPQTQRHASAF